MSNQKSARELLQANPWFAMLSDEHFEKLLSISTEYRWPEGQTIFREGDKDTNLYLILSGRVALEIHVPNQGKITILTVGENDLFGWSAILPVMAIKTAGARALQATRAVAFEALQLRQLCDEDHELGFTVYRRLTNVIAGRLTATRLQMLDMYAINPQGAHL